MNWDQDKYFRYKNIYWNIYPNEPKVFTNITARSITQCSCLYNTSDSVEFDAKLTKRIILDLQ